MTKLREIRIEADLTQTELADAVVQPDGSKGVATSYICGVERGARCPDWLAAEVAKVLSEALGREIRVGDLFDPMENTKGWKVRR